MYFLFLLFCFLNQGNDVCFRKKKNNNWKQRGHLDGEEEARIENHFLFRVVMPVTRMGNAGG